MREEKLGNHANNIDTGSELDAIKTHSSLLSPGSVGLASHHHPARKWMAHSEPVQEKHTP